MDNSFVMRAVGVTWQEILIQCVPAMCGKLDVDGQVRGILCECRAKNFKVFLQFPKNVKTLLRLP